jgi:Icc-related predicted phosphoesterase
MKLLAVSDLHFEFHKDGGKTLIEELHPADVLVIAGDLYVFGNDYSRQLIFYGLVAHLCKKYKHVIFVAGNHDFWYGEPTQILKFLRAEFKALKNFHFLENDWIIIDGQRFLGATLWFPDPGEDAPKKQINDFELIENFEPWVYEQNKTTIKFFKDNIKEDDIVITHHLPSEKSIAKFYKNNPLNCFFVHDIEEDIIKKYKPKVWVYGHTHSSGRFSIDNTRMICNPFGYARHSENLEFYPDLILNIENKDKNIQKNS